MIYERSVRALAFILVAAWPAISAARPFLLRPFKARAHFLATSTCIRGTWGLNLDLYLAELSTKKGSDLLMVRLVDEYGKLGASVFLVSLTFATGTNLRIRRDQQCDMPYAQMQLRTAPGDQIVILHERLVDQSQLFQTSGQNKVAQCYRPARQ